ncbi:hypothetical protein A0H81_03405 [Grifola frondosa]|uniref:DUF6534 domain-containing protein n=1 Tax=Grifola frondosa TaxID=5627 RepID=A0A1C7MJH7_GRIFR|nr:hypothetical protein A0H81_03405 [Grifola frondosa]
MQEDQCQLVVDQHGLINASPNDGLRQQQLKAFKAQCQNIDSVVNIEILLASVRHQYHNITVDIRTNPTVPSSNHTIGSALIGALFSMILYSCTCVQAIYYARKYPGDRFVLKALQVLFLWIFDTAICLYRYVVQFHANPIALLAVPMAFAAEFALVTCMEFLVQCYFIHNIWHLLQGKWFNYPLTVAALVLAIISLGAGAAVTYGLATVETLPLGLQNIKASGTLQSATCMVANAYITILLCLTLRGSKSDFKRTNRLVNKLIVYSMNRGFLTLAMQLCALVLYVTAINKGSLVWVIFHMSGAKIYINSLLAGLNVRRHLREMSASGNDSQDCQVFNFIPSQISSSSSPQV